MTRPITIGMISSYQGLNPSPVDWLWQQSAQPFGHWGKIQMSATAQQPDFLLLYQYDFPRPQPPLTGMAALKNQVKRQIKGQIKGQRQPQSAPVDPEAVFRGVPKERRIFLLREPPLAEVIDRNQANYAIAQENCGYVSGPEEGAPTPNYMPAIWYLNNAFRELDEMPAPAKTRTCSWITSGINRTENHRQRLGFLQSAQERSLDFDLYGRGLPTWAKAFGSLSNKWHAMSPYYYNLAIENYADNDWYASEKLWDALLSWCLPIYYGGGAATKLLPPESFLRLPSLDEKGLAYIQEVIASPDAWHERREAIAEARQIILHKLNLVSWLAEFVEQS
jgi:hypothetical protein